MYRPQEVAVEQRISSQQQLYRLVLP